MHGSRNLFSNEERFVVEFSNLGIKNAIRLGRLNYSKAHAPLPTHIHENILEICYLSKGKQTYTTGDTSYHLNGGDVFIASPNEYHGSGFNPEEKSILYWLLIDLSDPVSFLGYSNEDGSYLFHGLLNLKKKHFPGSSCLKEILDRILILYTTHKPFKKILIQNLISEFLIHIIELESAKSSMSISNEINRIVSHIHTNIWDHLSIESLADMSHLSVSRFKQRFKDEIGIPPKEYIIRAKIEKARGLLQNTNMSITAIAHELNFSSSQYFATVYKRITSKSPSDYRNK